MVKLTGPVMGLTASGWLGRGLYASKKVVLHPYPISFLGKIHIPYSIPAFGLRPYPAFISQYYNPKGWIYEPRRTWHGVINIARRAFVTTQPRTPFQLGYRVHFYEGAKIWKGMSEATKDIYRKWKYPIFAGGYNRFMSWFLKTTQPMAIYWQTLQRSSTDSRTIDQKFGANKKVFFKVGTQYDGAAFNLIQTYGVHPGAKLVNGAVNQSYTFGYIPADFGTLVSFSHVVGGGATGNLYVNEILRAGADGEVEAAHQYSGADHVQAVVSNKFKICSDISASVSWLSAGDFFGIYFQRKANNVLDTAEADFYVFGILMEYTPA